MKKVVLTALLITSCYFPEARSMGIFNLIPEEMYLTRVGEEVGSADGLPIQLMHFPQSQGVHLSESKEGDYSKGFKTFPNLGMNKTPVLNQGSHGTCVTFAATAALDAILGHGDYISQQCTLEMLVGLGKNYWDGAFYPSQIIDPLQENGVVSKSGCPRRYPSSSRELDLEEYKTLVGKLTVENVMWDYSDDASVQDVKESLDRGHRVMLGFLVDSRSTEGIRGFDVKVDGKKHLGGLWACTQGDSDDHCVNTFAGHEVVITGYDDKLKLFSIRNSWGQKVGSEGDYFMTFKFFEAMYIDSTEVY